MAANINKPPGRKAGVPNKLTTTVKDNLVSVFTRLGGTAAMADWARENQTEFYKLYCKLLPLQLTGADGGAVKIRQKIEIEFIGSNAYPDPKGL